MGMTLETMRAEVARRARMIVTNATHSDNIDFWINRAQEEVSNYTDWEFLQDEYELTFGPTSGNSQSLPITNRLAATSICSSVDLGSVRTSAKPIDWADPAVLDQFSEDWENGSVTGPIEWFTIVGNSMKVFKTPLTETTVKFRGWRLMPDLVEDDDETLVPDSYREVLVLGATYRAMHDRGHPDRDLVYGQYMKYLEFMAERLRFVRNKNRYIRANRLFALRGNRRTNVRT